MDSIINLSWWDIFAIFHLIVGFINFGWLNYSISYGEDPEDKLPIFHYVVYIIIVTLMGLVGLLLNYSEHYLRPFGQGTTFHKGLKFSR